MFEWVSTYLSLNVYIGLNGYTPRYLAEFLPIFIVVSPPKIGVEKSELLLKSLESLEPWSFCGEYVKTYCVFVYQAKSFGHVGDFSSLEQSIN